MQTPLRLAIIEDQVSIRETLEEYLSAQPEFTCGVVAGSMEEFLAALDAPDTAAQPPQVVLSDIGLPGRSGIEGLPFIHERLPAAQVLMLSVFSDAERIFEALQAGAVGYLLKNTPLAQLKEHLLQVAAGGSPMSPGVARQVVQAFQRLSTPPPALPTALAPAREGLTIRELEVVRSIEDGLSYKLIAERHFISLDTVRNHIRAVYRKLQINSRSELMAHALKRQQ